MDCNDRPDFDAEHTRDSLGLPAHGRRRKWDTPYKDVAPTSLKPRPISLRIYNPDAGRPDDQVVDVCPATRQRQVVQYHPMPPWQTLQQGRRGELSCGAPGPAARVLARPQDRGRAAGAQREGKDGPIAAGGKLRQPKEAGHPKAGGHPVDDYHKCYKRQRGDHERQSPRARPSRQLPRIQSGATCTVDAALTGGRCKRTRHARIVPASSDRYRPSSLAPPDTPRHPASPPGPPRRSGPQLAPSRHWAVVYWSR
jgi:hypothetical protein